MIKIRKEIERPSLNFFRDLSGKVFFDIETTGFSWKSAKCYLIGVLYEEDGKIFIEQFFADDLSKEKDLLNHFYDFLNDYDTLISFNGDGFDIPFLKNRARALDIERDITLKSVDILKLIRPYKDTLPVPNLKLKTLEKYLGIYRKDLYDGGKLIKVYYNYIKTKDKALRELILLHNFEDIKNMLPLDRLLSEVYKEKELIEGLIINQISIQKNTIKITGEFKKSMGEKFFYKGLDSVSISGHSLAVKLTLEEKYINNTKLLTIERYKKPYLNCLITKNPQFLPRDLLIFSADGRLNMALIKEVLKILLKFDKNNEYYS